MIALNEVKPKNGSVPNLEILRLPGFDLFTNDLQQSDTTGTCIYVRTEIRACQNNHPIIDQFADAMWITFNANGTSNLIGCIYRSGTHETARQRDKQLHVHKPTRYRHSQQPTLDDLIFTSYEKTVTNLNYGSHLGTSDHISLNMNLNISVTRVLKSRTIYSYDKTV